MYSQTCIQAHTHLLQFPNTQKLTAITSITAGPMNTNQVNPTQEWQRVTLGAQEYLYQYHNLIENLQVSCSNFGMLTAILVTHQMPRWQSTLQNRFIVKTSLKWEVSNWHTQRYNYLQFLQISWNSITNIKCQGVPICTIFVVIVSTKVCYGLQDAIFVTVVKLDILLIPFSKVIFWDTG